MAFLRFVNPLLRFLQFASAMIVVGIIGHYLDVASGSWPGGRFIYSEFVAALAALLALVLIIPSTWDLTLYPVDLFMFLLWIIAFGLLCDYIAPMNCTINWHWTPGYGNNTQQQCETWKTALAFMFVSAILWLISGLLAVWLTHRAAPAAPRRKWYRSHV